MTVSHLLLPWTWEECLLEGKDCMHVIHQPTSPEELHGYPQEWVKSLIPNSEITDESIRLFNANNNLHNYDGPAVVSVDGSKHWFVHGKRHRYNQPAVILPDGTQEWWYVGNFLRRVRETPPNQ